MAITINGTGTITGISAGGLPDGSVVAADLASSLDLTGKTVTLPSGTGGKVIGTKFQWMQATTVSVGSANTWTDAGVDFTYTPVSSTSVLHISLAGILAGQNNSSVRLRETANSVSNILDVTAVGGSSIAYGDLYNHGNSNWGFRHQHLAWHYAPGVTSELTFDLQVVGASSMTFYVGRMQTTSNPYEITSGVQLSIIEYDATRSELT
jgi:hypothetical protein